MHKLPIPTYRADEFTGSTHVCGISNVDKVLFTLWITRAKICKDFNYDAYYDRNPNSKMSSIIMIGKMIIAKRKCLQYASKFGDISKVKI